YWWDQVDARLDIIARHGLHAMINLDSTYVPAWMEEESQADEEGMVNGLWHGGGNNVLKSPSSPALWRDYGDYLTQLVLRYRNNPTLVAYSSLSIFFDHVWADHPWQGQYVDYSEAARVRFRSYLRDVRGLSLTDLSRRWGRPLASWNDIELPRTDLFLGLATIDRPDPRPKWRDFLDFRAWSQAAYITGLVAGTVRKYDDIRPIGTHGVLADAKWYHQNGMFVCAGSSEGSLDSYKPFEFPKRAESIAMSFYTPYYTAMSMTNLLAQSNLNVQNFWMPQWRWDDCGREDRQTGTQALAGWLALFQGELGKATPVRASGSEPSPVLGLLYSRDSILYGVRSFHWPRLDDYRQLAERACTVPKATIMQDVTAAELSKLPCVIVDPTARILPADTIQRLKAYVEGGGKLVLSPTSGMYASDAPAEPHALRRALGLPLPKSKWVTAAEHRQPGDYSPYYPFEVTGKGTPGEQSLSEPGQTAGAKPAATGIFRTTPRLVFRLGPYTMYNRDTWGDWAHMLPAFLYGRTHEGGVVGGTVEATWEDG
ncbi:MAG: alpha-amylase family protein, partial [Armatimonadota bacterium]